MDHMSWVAERNGRDAVVPFRHNQHMPQPTYAGDPAEDPKRHSKCFNWAAVCCLVLFLVVLIIFINTQPVSNRFLNLVLGAIGVFGGPMLLAFLPSLIKRLRDSRDVNDGTGDSRPATDVNDGTGISLPSDVQMRPPREYSYTVLEQATHNFATVLGTGGQAVVYKGVLPEDKSQLVAVKRLRNTQPQDVFKREVHILGSVHHRNLVQLHGYCIHAEDRLLVFEFVSNGSLHDWLFKQNHPILDWKQRLAIAKGAASGLQYLHEGCRRDILHLDVKPQNILIDGHDPQQLRAKIADFGLAKLIRRDQSHLSDSMVGGTLGYACPEVLERRRDITNKADVYSFGIVLLQMVTGRELSDAPIPGLSFGDAIILTARRIELLDARLEGEGGSTDGRTIGLEMAEIGICKSTDGRTIGLKMAEIGIRCIQRSPDDRPSMAEVLGLLVEIEKRLLELPT